MFKKGDKNMIDMISKNVKTILKRKITYLAFLFMGLIVFTLWPIENKPRTFATIQSSFTSCAVMLFMISFVVLFGELFAIFSGKRNDDSLSSSSSSPNEKKMFLSKLFTIFMLSYLFESSGLFIMWMILRISDEEITMQTILTSFVVIPLFGLAIVELLGLLYIFIQNKKTFQIALIITLALAVVQSYNKSLNLNGLPLTASMLIMASTGLMLYFVTLKVYRKWRKGDDFK